MKYEVVSFFLLLLRWKLLLIQSEMCWFLIEKFLSSNRPFFLQLASQNILNSLFILLLFTLLFLLGLGVILHVDVIEIVV